MLILGDMPLIRTNTINLLFNEFKKNNCDKIIFPLYIKEQANPVIFPKKYFSEILDLDGDIGCKKIVKKYHEDTIGVLLNSDEVVVDCDTMDDYFLIEKKLQNKFFYVNFQMVSASKRKEFVRKYFFLVDNKVVVMTIVSFKKPRKSTYSSFESFIKNLSKLSS